MIFPHGNLQWGRFNWNLSWGSFSEEHLSVHLMFEHYGLIHNRLEFTLICYSPLKTRCFALFISKIKKHNCLLLLRALFIQLEEGRVELSEMLIFETLLFFSSLIMVDMWVCFCLSILMLIILRKFQSTSHVWIDP